MAIEEVNKIKEIFSNLGVPVEYLEHEPAITSEEASKVHGVELKQGVKAIVFTNGSEFGVVNVPANKKVDFKIVALLNGWSNSKTRIAKPEEVLKITGCEIGSVPPFGHKEKIKMFFDRSVFDNNLNLFNIGLRTHSIKIKTEDLKKVFTQLNLIEGNFIK